MIFIFTLILHYFSGPDPCEAKVDLCLIVDASDSITFYNPPDGSYDNWQLQLDFLSLLVDLFTIGPDATRVGAVVFSEDVRLAFSLDTYTDVESVKKAIYNLDYLDQQTNTAEAFRVTREECFNIATGDRPNIQNLAIIISDGRPEPNADMRIPAALQEAQALRDTGVIILAIGVTDRIDADFLRDMSSLPQIEGQNYFTATDFNFLGTIRRSLVEETCEKIKGNLSF